MKRSTLLSIVQSTPRRNRRRVSLFEVAVLLVVGLSVLMMLRGIAGAISNDVQLEQAGGDR